MTDGLQNLREDVAFMRALAEEGRSGPLLGGPILVAAGVAFGGASLWQYAALSGWVGDPDTALGLGWIISGFAFGAAMLLFVRRTRAQRGAAATINKGVNAAWTGVGFAIFAMFGALILATVRTGEEVIFYLINPIILGLYGAAWSVAGAFSERPWIKGVAGLCLIFAVATGWLTGTKEQSLVYALALLCVAILPGLALMRQARQA